MKEINYKIKKGCNSYLWRGEGKRWYKARFRKDWHYWFDTKYLIPKKL